jgi:hypothetical protein
MSLNPNKAREMLGAVSRAQNRNDTGDTAVALLNFLLRQLEELRDLANGYPKNPIAGDVWFSGKALAELCDELTVLLATRGLPEQEELASRLATGMALQVMGHYPEEVFPRVLRNARCREALGQVKEAISGYEAIVNDYDQMGLAEILEDDQLDASSRIILECVRDASARLGELDPERSDALGDLNSSVREALESGTA